MNEGWTAKRIAQLGTATDRIVAVRLSCTQQCVRRARKKYGIPPFRSKTREWTENEIALLGQDSDTRIAEKLDSHLYEVATKRRQLKIPGYSGRRHSNCRWKWGPTELLMFRTYEDEEIANITYRPLDLIKAMRAELEELRPTSCR